MNLNKLFTNGFANYLLSNNLGKVTPLIIPINDEYIANCNPSIYNDDGNLKVLVRKLNYIFSHSESEKYVTFDGPLQYLHPETDINLRTFNQVVDLDSNLQPTHIHNIQLNESTPKWNFVGLEDARLFRWNGNLFICGVRRDIDDKGTGRMELVQLDSEYKEINKLRIEVPEDNENDYYCEKNWMPILDKPYHFIRYTNPTQVIKLIPKDSTVEGYSELSSKSIVDRNLSGSEIFNDSFLRGNTQVIPYKGYYIAFVHTVKLWKPLSGSKNSVYLHRIVIWDKNFKLLAITNDFSLLNFKIEFSCGLCLTDHDTMILSTSTSDSAPYLIEFNAENIINLILEDARWINS